MTQRLWFLTRAWFNATFRPPVCDSCDKRHGSDIFSATYVACAIAKEQKRIAERQEQENIQRQPKRLISISVN